MRRDGQLCSGVPIRMATVLTALGVTLKRTSTTGTTGTHPIGRWAVRHVWTAASQLVTWSTRHSPKSYDELIGASNAMLSLLLRVDRMLLST